MDDGHVPLLSWGRRQSGEPCQGRVHQEDEGHRDHEGEDRPVRRQGAATSLGSEFCRERGSEVGGQFAERVGEATTGAMGMAEKFIEAGALSVR